MTDLGSCQATIRSLTRVADGLDSAAVSAQRSAARAGRWADGFIGSAADAHHEACRALASDLAAESEATRGLARALGRFVDDTREAEAMRSAGLVDRARERDAEIGLAWVDALWRYDAGLPVATPLDHPLAPPAFVAAPRTQRHDPPAPGPHPTTEPDPAPHPEPHLPLPGPDDPDDPAPPPNPPNPPNQPSSVPGPGAQPVHQIRTLPAPHEQVVEPWPLRESYPHR